MLAVFRIRPIAAAALALSAAIAQVDADPTHAAQIPGDETWSHYGADAGGTRFSALEQITRRNVTDLEIAWIYRTGELGEGMANAGELAFAATPILARDTLYLSTPTNIVVALDPTTGRERWRFDPRISRSERYAEVISRGVSSWIDAEAPSTAHCAHRIFIGTLDARLIALDGRSGRPCTQFGGTGAIDLSHGAHASAQGAFRVVSPPAIYRDLVIVGSAMDADRAARLGHGVVRAYDARSGALVWSWDPFSQGVAQVGRHARQDGRKPLRAQGAGAIDAWSSFSVDTGRGLVFVPTGSGDSELFGVEPGENEFANSLVALRARDGELVWHRQLVHRDRWDYGLAAQPLLVDIERDGKSIAAVVQATKTGMLFVFDRESGEPVLEIVERPVPKSDVPAERSSPTQPFPATPPLVSHAAITPQHAWGLTFYDRGKCRAQIARYRSEGLYTPPSARGTIVSPSHLGGINWGSMAFDSERHMIIAAVNHVPAVMSVIPLDARRTGKDGALHAESASQDGAGYTIRRELLLSPWGLPCTPPPWGTLAAVDLRRNSIRWQVALGSTGGNTPWFVPSRTLGMPNMGGPLVTAGGLVFIGAATDDYLRAFDIDTGRELWKARLPAGGQSTPMSFLSGGRQYVVITAGGHGKLGTTRGDYVVAFALP